MAGNNDICSAIGNKAFSLRLSFPPSNKNTKREQIDAYCYLPTTQLDTWTTHIHSPRENTSIHQQTTRNITTQCHSSQRDKQRRDLPPPPQTPLPLQPTNLGLRNSEFYTGREGISDSQHHYSTDTTTNIRRHRCLWLSFKVITLDYGEGHADQEYAQTETPQDWLFPSVATIFAYSRPKTMDDISSQEQAVAVLKKTMESQNVRSHKESPCHFCFVFVLINNTSITPRTELNWTTFCFVDKNSCHIYFSMDLQEQERHRPFSPLLETSTGN